MTGVAPTAAARRSGAPAAFAALAVFAAVIVVNAVAQALIVSAAPPLPLGVGALALAAASGVVLFAATVACWWIAGGARRAAGAPWALTVLVAATGIIAVVAATVAPPAVPLVVALGCAVVSSGGPRAAVALVRRHPARWVLLSVATAAAVLLAWVAALLTGLLVTGAPASAITWLVAGMLAAPLIRAWTGLARR